MIRKTKKVVAWLVTLAMICTAVLGCFQPMQVQAEQITKTMAHLKAGDGNGNGHFGGGSPEAFVLSDNNDITNEAFSFQTRIGSTKEETRFRFVNKYVDDTHWSYIAYDGLNANWFCEYKNGNASSWPGLSGLPVLNQNDMVNISGTYEEDGLHITVENVTTGDTGSAVATDESFLGLQNQAGKIGFGAAKYGSQYTEIYFADVTVGENVYADYNSWTQYKEDGGGIWEPAVDVVIAGEPDEPDEPDQPGTGRAWWTITGGSNNSGGHAYGNAGTKAPILLLDNDRTMAAGGTLNLAVKPSNNWGVFYSYVDDNNWLYVGWDSTSHWYYQYKLNGSESYPKIGGLTDPVVGEEIQMSISLNQETLSVTVNGVQSNVTNQTLIQFTEQNGGKGRFGVKTNGQTTLSFADVNYNGTDCMEDSWVFCAERTGQIAEKTYTKVVPLTGMVTDKESGNPLKDAVVRVGLNSARTDEDGRYTFEGLELGSYNMAVTKPGYQAYEETIVIEDVTGDDTNVKDVALSAKADLNMDDYDTIQSDIMKVYIGKEFPLVARYQMLSDEEGSEAPFFRGNEGDIAAVSKVEINSVEIVPTVTVAETTDDSRTYNMHVEDADNSINLDMQVKVSVAENTLTWEVTKLEKAEGCAKIATIDVPGLNLLTVDASEEGANFAGAQASTSTTTSGDSFIDFEEGFVPSETDGYLYAFLTNGKLSAGLYSNSEIEGDKRVIRNNGADTISLTSAAWYYELGDKAGQTAAAKADYEYPVSELPCTKVAIAADANEDGDIDWNDGALAFRKIMNIPYGSDAIKDLVNYRIVMNFASMASNPYLVTADNIKKVYLATDGLPQAVMLKGYGNEGHDSANSEYADIAEREGGVEDFQKLIQIAHDYNTEIGIHVNAQEVYPEAASFNENMLLNPITNGWGWLDQSHVIDKHWDLATEARWKRFVQLYDRINGTNHYSRIWPEAVEDSKGEVDASKEEIRKEAESLEDNMDFIYLDVWYQDAWETRQIAKEINSLGWRFSTEFSAEGEYDSTWQHWSTDATYGGSGAKGYNSDIIRFIRNDQRDSQVLNYPSFGGTADNPLLGGYRLYGFEGWGGDKDFDNYILQTFNENLPTKFLQHYYVTDWENYEDGESPVGNHEKQITLKNDQNDVVVVTRNEAQRSDDNIERTITLNGRVVLNDVTYLLPWTDEDGTEKLYHWNLDGGSTSWQLPEGWGSAVMYELSDQGRINETEVVADGNGMVTLDAEAATAYVLVKGASVKTLKNDFGEKDYVVDPGFNGYAAGDALSSEDWSGDITDSSVVVEKASTGDQRLAFNSPAKDVAVTTTISGLKAGTNYVAEVYVENNSDAKAAITVNAGSKTVSNYTERSILNNYVQSDQKNGTKMQRMQISFTAETTTAELTLSREAGEGSSYMDDIRIVEKTLNNVQEDGSFRQDFESVVQGLYPFVLSSAQGISDPVTHLSQLHEPYTQAGWNGRVMDDVLEGNWSLKHHAGANTGIIYQTIPQNFRFEAGKVYKVEFDYQSGPDKAYAMVVGDGVNYTLPTEDQYLAQARGTTQHVEMQVLGSGSGQTWIGLYEKGSKAGSGSMGQMDFVLDNLVITEDKDAVVVTLDKTTLYKGETAKIFGNKLDEVVWTSSDESVADVDKDASVVNALKAGTVTITAALPNGETETFDLVVEDEVVVDIPREELEGITASANTEESWGESGEAANTVDGSSSTIWHSNWSTGFVVSEDNPAVLTVDLGAEMQFGGFMFQQRPSGPNGTVQQYSYRILAEDGETVLAAGEHIEVAVNNQTNGAWEIAQFEESVNGRYIEISVEKGYGSFASIAEVAPFLVQKVTEEATLEDITLKAGESIVLVPGHAENTVLKGLVWSSSDKSIATVNQQGNVTALEPGKATIMITNAAGLQAECTVTVVKLEYEALDEQIAQAEAINLADYKDDARKEAFVKALENAKEVRESASTQEEIAAATKALAEAQYAMNPIEEKNGLSDTKAEDGNWYYYTDNEVDKNYTGLAKNKNGWYYVHNGQVDFTYTGFASNKYGDWYVERGQVKFNKYSVIKDKKGALGTEGTWYYVVKSKVIYTDTVAKNEKGWWVIQDGKVNFAYTGFASNKHGDWYAEKGKVKFDKYSVIKDTRGTLGTKGTWYYVSKSKVVYRDTVAKNEKGWWKITNGKVDFGYNGIAQNAHGWWKITNGKVNFGYTGKVKADGKTYQVVKGKVVR